MSVPADLIPLPTQPWDSRPNTVALTVEEARTALWINHGNVTNAANTLKVTSSRLRSFIKKSPYLLREQEEAREQLLDRAESVVREALNDDDAVRKDTMARYVLSNIGRHRGFGSSSTKVNLNVQNTTFQIAWENGSVFGDQKRENIIDGELSEEAA